MPKSTFCELCDWLKRYGGLQASKKITVEEQVALFLAVVGHDCTNHKVQERFQIGGFTVTK